MLEFGGCIWEGLSLCVYLGYSFCGEGLSVLAAIIMPGSLAFLYAFGSFVRGSL
jgi:hypothetical protein